MQRTSQTRTIRTGAIALLILASLWLLAACLPQPPGAGARSTETVEVIVGDLEANATASGTLEPRREATLQAATPARVTAVNVRVGQVVSQGDPLVALDPTDLELNRDAAELSVRQQEASLADLLAEPTATERAAAEAAVANAQAQLDDLLDGPSAAELAAYEASLSSAQASVQSASADLTSAAGQVTDADLKAAEAQLAAAQIQLTQAQEANRENTNQATHEAMLEAEQAVAAAQARVDDLRDGPDTAAAQSSVGAASARLESSRADYERQTSGATAAQIASAEAQLAESQASLADLLGGATAEAIAAAEAELEQARISLADAEAALAEATITAPFDGVVAAVHVQPGEMAAGPVVELVDLGSLQVILSVDEADIGSLAVGQPATVTLEAWPDAPIEAVVASIAPASTADPATGLVTYEVRLDLSDTSLPVLAGMTADAALVTAEKRDVLLVPNEAIDVDRTTGTYTVRRVSGDATETIEIVVGLRDGQYTEVRDGLEAGDQLLVGVLPQQTFDGPGQGGGPFGGN